MPFANHSNIIVDNYGNFVVVSGVTGSEHDSTSRFAPSLPSFFKPFHHVACIVILYCITYNVFMTFLLGILMFVLLVVIAS